MFLQCIGVWCRCCVCMISMHCVHGLLVVCGLFVFFSSGVCAVQIRVDSGLSLGYLWCVHGVWGLPINVVSGWYGCGRCLVCMVNCGVCMVYVSCVHGMLLGGLSVVRFFYRSGVCCDVTPEYRL